jgi:hypothetical protein
MNHHKPVCAASIMLSSRAATPPASAVHDLDIPRDAEPGSRVPMDPTLQYLVTHLGGPPLFRNGVENDGSCFVASCLLSTDEQYRRCINREERSEHCERLRMGISESITLDVYSHAVSDGSRTLEQFKRDLATRTFSFSSQEVFALRHHARFEQYNFIIFGVEETSKRYVHYWPSVSGGSDCLLVYHRSSECGGHFESVSSDSEFVFNESCEWVRRVLGLKHPKTYLPLSSSSHQQDPCVLVSPTMRCPVSTECFSASVHRH